VARVYSGAFMTSLDMAGVSLTLLTASPELLRLLDAPTSAPGWPSTPAACTPVKAPAPLPSGTASSAAAAAGAGAAAQDAVLLACIKAAAEALVGAAAELDELDAKTGGAPGRMAAAALGRAGLRWA
jgi:dihydroxyacetone kinase